MIDINSSVEVSSRVISVIVTFYPDVDLTFRLVKKIINDVDQVLIIDNGSGADSVYSLQKQCDLFDRISLIRLSDNLGIAQAQNVGIERAFSLGCDFVLLFDQDSIPADNMLFMLLAAARNLQRQRVNIGALGPRYTDDRQKNPPPFIKVRLFNLERMQCVSEDSVVEVDYLIASGSLIPVETLRQVGGMADELFIDYVDIEWGLRAQQMGFQSFGVCAAKMGHSLGDEPIRFLGRSFPARSPLRHYYMFRNAIWMYKQGHIPTQWKIADAWRLVLKFVFYTIFAKPRLKHLQMMSRGLIDGILGKMGRFR